MEADFSGWATKAGLKCKDGRTIMHGAFKHQDQTKVPLVWQHGHSDPTNVLGHAILQARDEGVYAYAFFNDTPAAQHAAGMVEHGDITQMSIWANELVERSKQVFHGAIKEVSLVLAGANPGAVIENISIRHADGMTDLEEEAIIFTGLELEHADDEEEESDTDSETDDDETDDGSDQKTVSDEDTSDTDNPDNTDNEEKETEVQHAATDTDDTDETVGDIYNSLTPKQKDVVAYMVGEALASAGNTNNLEQSDMNVFDMQNGGAPEQVHLSHDDLRTITADATRSGSLKEAVENYALSHGIDDIDVLFPDAQAVDAVPEFLARRTEWVRTFIGAVRKSPFSRIKTFSADITMDEARAKGYVKGSMKKEEFFRVASRKTTPTTVYKKQKLDRDDIIDITDFDVVAWLKTEMRLMLDEEIARASLMGDGREADNPDKIDEDSVRPIATDHDLFATKVFVPMSGDNAVDVASFIDSIVSARRHYKGTGTPNMYTSETWISKVLLLKDTLGRRIYQSIEQLATELRVSQIVPVEVFDEATDGLIAIIVNPVDYTFGATRGGEVSMFDDFDIDYNQHKYLIEGRMCGALTKLKSALVIRSVANSDTLRTPAEPIFDAEAGTVTIVDTTGVVYKNGVGTTISAATSPITVPEGETYIVKAEPTPGNYFATSEGDEWVFVNR